MTPERRTFDRVDVPIPVGRLLRLELHHDADGEPEALTTLGADLRQASDAPPAKKKRAPRAAAKAAKLLATGWGDPALPDPEKTLILPAETLPDLRAALTALDT